MSSQNFCSSLKIELSAWKDSVADIVHKFEAQPGYAKAGVLENIEDMRILVEDLQDRIHQLEETCSLDGFDDVNTQRKIDMQFNVNVRDADQAVSTISGGNFGG
ncbi:MAG: hypothetical protein ABIK68_11105 [bacterium]|nr:hypothetical protein [bacterium]